MLLRVDRAAICGTDLHPYHGRMEIEEGFILGHEYLGTIEEKGDGVMYLEEGDRVVGSFYVSCGKCWFCRRNINHKCQAIRVFGMGMAMGDLPGAQSQYIRVPGGGPHAARAARRTGSTTRTSCSSATSSRPATTRCARSNMKPGRRGRGDRRRPGRPVHRDVRAGARRRQVVAVDMVPERLKLAEQLGAIARQPEGGRASTTPCST